MTAKLDGSDMEASGSSDGGRRRNCRYRYMLPSYSLDEEYDPATSYSVVADALLENSSAHGLPTLYRARGSILELPTTALFFLGISLTTSMLWPTVI